jgi:uncharacterized SAM-binding protein YcdF (DUF218 family)
MPFSLSDIADFVSAPSNLIVLFGLTGLFCLVVRWKKLGGAAITLSIALMVIFGWLPSGSMLLRLLEERFPVTELPEDIEGVILLGGAVDSHLSVRRDQPILNGAAERITTTMALSRLYPSARIVLSGGGGDHSRGEPVTESGITRQILAEMGMDLSRILLEDTSVNTCENAARTRDMLETGPSGTWLLVTSAAHMPRAVACFRASNFEVVPVPVDYRTGTSLTGYGGRFGTIAEGLVVADLAAYEWLGLVAYRVTGRTVELFPQP